MRNEDYRQVKCPGPPSGVGCGRYLTKPEFSHHCLYMFTCPECKSQWRIYHDALSPTVELTYTEFTNKNDELALLSVSYGRHELKAPEAVETAEVQA